MRVKRLKFNWLTAVALVLVAVTVTALIGNLSGGFQKGVSDWKLREVNEDNLYQSLTFLDDDGVFASGENGISAKLDDDNVIKVSGTADADSDIEIGKITLKAGTSYVFESSLRDASNKTVYMSVVKASDKSVIKSSYESPILTSVSEDTEVIIVLTIKAETKVNATLRPVLCKATSVDDVIDFYG